MVCNIFFFARARYTYYNIMMINGSNKKLRKGGGMSN